MYCSVLLVVSVVGVTGVPRTTRDVRTNAAADATELPLPGASSALPPAAPPYRTPFQTELLSRVNDEAERASRSPL